VGPEKKYKEKLAPVSLIAYGIIRFVLEFFRGDAGRGEWLALSSSQWISIAIIIVCVLCLVLQRKRKIDEVPT